MSSTNTDNFSSRFFDGSRRLNLATGNATQTGRLGSTNPVEFFKVRLNRRSSLTLRLSELTTPLQVSLLNRSGKTVERSNFNSATKLDTYDSLKPGVYYLQVARQAGSTAYYLELLTKRQPTSSPASDFQKSDSQLASRQAVERSEVSRGDRLIRQVVKLTNLHRQQAGLQPLRVNATLNTAAYAHSLDMATQDFFSHVGSDGSTVFNRLDTAGYSYATAGENIAAGFTTAKTVVEAWMNSPTHRQNILTPFVEEVGIGYVFLPNDSGKLKLRSYWTQDFGVPKN